MLIKKNIRAKNIRVIKKKDLALHFLDAPGTRQESQQLLEIVLGTLVHEQLST